MSMNLSTLFPVASYIMCTAIINMRLEAYLNHFVNVKIPSPPCFFLLFIANYCASHKETHDYTPFLLSMVFITSIEGVILYTKAELRWPTLIFF